MTGPVPSDTSPPSPSAELTDDCEALRHAVGVVTVAREVILVSGPDALEYLQGQCSQDVAALEIGMSADALLLTPQGKLDALVRVTRSGEDDLYVDVDAGYGTAVMARLARFKLRVKVGIEPVDWRVVALRGPGSATVVDGVTAPAGTSFVVPYAWGGVTGVDLLGADPQIPALVRRCGPAAWQTLRVEAGIPVMGAELDERTIAAEADLLERCVSFTKGCYTGQELVARLDARGNKVARHLRAVAVDPGQSARATLRPGAEVSVGDKVVGRLTSVAWSPVLGTAVALCYLHRDVEPSCAVRVQVEGITDATAAAHALTLPLAV
ncbi:MAG TPA: glycine cleavage T C-terminal barrel domain-containing protein [Acidimicrobiales bacterium]|nr:glycine cleavage T C-terminal barrel domain-containing protein [Acidimicrobiales bacterium]